MAKKLGKRAQRVKALENKPNYHVLYQKLALKFNHLNNLSINYIIEQERLCDNILYGADCHGSSYCGSNFDEEAYRCKFHEDFKCKECDLNICE